MVTGGNTRRRAPAAAMLRQQAKQAKRYQRTQLADDLSGASPYYDAPPGGSSWVIQPFEVLLRFPSQPFDYGGELTIAQGAAAATIASFTVPVQYLGVLREVLLYSTLPAGILDLTELELTIDGVPSRNLLVPGSPATAALIPFSGFEPPAWTFNVRLQSGMTVVLRAGRAAGVDPTAYTYRARLRGWFWPRYKRRRR